MSDIVEQLRNYGLSHLKGTPSVIAESADEIERLRARAEAAEKERDAALFDKAVARGKVRVAEDRAEAAEKLLRRLVDACGYVRPINGDVCMEKVTDMRNAMKFIEAVEAARAALEVKP